MKSDKCPKCGATEVYTNINVSPKPIIPISTMGKAKIVHYVCAECGYTEMYFAEEYLGKIKQKWEKV